MKLSQLKKNNSLEKLTKAIADNSKQSYSKDDERFWQPEVDKVGNGYAVVRLLDAPAVDGEDALPWVQIFNHGFHGPAGWYIENCSTTINAKCPACEHNTKLWNSGIEANKAIVRNQKRRLNYIANILLITDAKHPESEGKVFLWRFGKKIFDKIQEKLTPEFEDEKAMNPFDFWKGANLKVKIRNVEGFRNYDKSEFEDSAPIADSDAEIERLWKSAHSLKEFVAPDQFKPYDELKAKLNRVLGAGGAAAASKIDDDEHLWKAPEEKAATTTMPKAEDTSLDVDGDLSYFDRLAQE